MTRGHGYITIVVDRHTGRLLWVPPGRDRRTLAKFLEALGEHQLRDNDARLGRRGDLDRRGGRRHRYTLWKNPEDLTDRQQKKLAWVFTVNRRLYRAYLLN